MTDRVLSPAAQALLEDLATGIGNDRWQVRHEDLGGWDGTDSYLIKRKPLDRAAFQELRSAGFIEDHANGGGASINATGQRAHIQSTDEMGDGRVHLHLQGRQ